MQICKMCMPARYLTKKTFQSLNCHFRVSTQCIEHYSNILPCCIRYTSTVSTVNVKLFLKLFKLGKKFRNVYFKSNYPPPWEGVNPFFIFLTQKFAYFPLWVIYFPNSVYKTLKKPDYSLKFHVKHYRIW